jgi:hypothetical protein
VTTAPATVASSTRAATAETKGGGDSGDLGVGANADTKASDGKGEVETAKSAVSTGTKKWGKTCGKWIRTKGSREKFYIDLNGREHRGREA